MTNRRHDLAEMTALYLIPIVAIVIAATSGALVAGALENERHQLWTLMVSYVFWGIGTPLSWIILTVYFLRMMVHKPLQREVIVSLLLPIGPLGLSGFSYVNKIPCFQISSRWLLILLQADSAWKGRQTQLSIDRNNLPCGPGWGNILYCWLDSRYPAVGFCVSLVCHRYRHDSYDVPLPVQYGLVGLHIPYR